MNMKYIKTIETIPYDFRLQAHILSHFHKLDEGYKNLLTANYDINNEGIETRLSMTGSKFNESFAINPIALYEIILSGYKSYQKTIIERESTIDIVISYPLDSYKSGIGMDGIININELSEKEKLNIKTKTREGHYIKMLSKKQKPTWELNILIDNNPDNKYYIKTIFPGKHAPPFPNKELQGNIDYNIFFEFWDKHIFLI